MKYVIIEIMAAIRALYPEAVGDELLAILKGDNAVSAIFKTETGEVKAAILAYTQFTGYLKPHKDALRVFPTFRAAQSWAANRIGQ